MTENDTAGAAPADQTDTTGSTAATDSAAGDVPAASDQAPAEPETIYSTDFAHVRIAHLNRLHEIAAEIRQYVGAGAHHLVTEFEQLMQEIKAAL